jgi:hypothetical protein
VCWGGVTRSQSGIVGSLALTYSVMLKLGRVTGILA